MSVKKAGNKRIVLRRPLSRRLQGYFYRTPGFLPVRRHLIFFSFHIILVRRRSNSCPTRVRQLSHTRRPAVRPGSAQDCVGCGRKKLRTKCIFARS